MKKAPYYSVTELHMIPGMDDDLYDLFAPNLTVARTPGVNVNSMRNDAQGLLPAGDERGVRAVLQGPGLRGGRRDVQDQDDFYKYVAGKFQAYSRGSVLEDIKKQLAENNVRFVVDETEFRITVRAQMNQSTRLIEAWVTLGSKKPATGTGPNAQPSGVPTPAATINLSGNGPAAEAPDPGVKIHFMRIL